MMRPCRAICVLLAGLNVGLEYGFTLGFVTFVFLMILCNIAEALEDRK